MAISAVVAPIRGSSPQSERRESDQGGQPMNEPSTIESGSRARALRAARGTGLSVRAGPPRLLEGAGRRHPGLLPAGCRPRQQPEPNPGAAAARRRREARTSRRTSAPGCTSARTARSRSTPARRRSARTSARRLTQAVAEELHAAPSSIRLVMADTQLTPFDMGTFGSRTTPDMSRRLRRTAAAAREMLDRPRGRDLEGRPRAADGRRRGHREHQDQGSPRIRQADQGPQAHEDRRR